MRKLILLFVLLPFISFAQNDSTQKWNLHFQQTVVEQYHPDFYSGISNIRTSTGVGGTNTGGKSLYAGTEKCMSLTTTLFAGFNIYKNLEFYFNPEVAGGSGFSGATGIAGFSNGETFRVGDPGPNVYIARGFFRYTIGLNNEKIYREDDQNKVSKFVPSERVIITAGKFSISDIFDQNITSHDPKTSLLNWSMMDAGAWDYPSNTRGYTYALSVKLVKKQYICRVSTAYGALWSNGPITANKNFLPTLQNYKDNHGEMIEFTYPLNKNFSNFIKVMGFANHGRMASYADATSALNLGGHTDAMTVVTDNSHLVSPVLDSLRGNGKSYYGKYGVILNWEKNFNNNKLFVRASWNDGKRETWMYTEIDESLCFGAFITPFKNRHDDVVRVAVALNGISKDHADYLTAGGRGFMIGDGYGNYSKGVGMEDILEAQYNYVYRNFTFTPDYQFIVNPAYNCSRGPVNVFGFRLHYNI